MWVRIKDSGQEIDMVPHKARYFVACGEAVEIATPTPRVEEKPPEALYEPPKVLPDVTEATTDAEIEKAAKKYAYVTGIKAMEELVAHTLKLERRIVQLEARK